VDTSDALVQLKLGLLDAAAPMLSAIVYGDIYRVDGAYTVATLERGSNRTLLIDTLETPAWLHHRLEHPQIDFLKGDFSDPFLMGSVRDEFDVGVVFDILLHQAPLLHTLHLMLSKVTRAICIAQPCLKEGGWKNQLVYLPGSADADLYPLNTSSPEYRVFDVNQVNHSHWIWAMTSSFVRSALAGEGFEIREEQTLEHPMLTEHWVWKGFVAERARANESHWSNQRATPGLYTTNW
jgi:DNA-binding transcriptional LysR family regulator